MKERIVVYLKILKKRFERDRLELYENKMTAKERQHLVGRIQALETVIAELEDIVK